MNLKSAIFLFFISINCFADNKHFIIGVENTNYLPISSVKNNEYYGYNKDILDYFAKDNGYIFDYKPLPILRLYASFINGEIDAKFPDNPNWKTEQKKTKKIFYSSPILTSIDGVMIKKKSHNHKITNSIGIVSGFTPWAIKDLINDKKISLYENNDVESLTKQVLNDRIDGIYANIYSINYQLEILNKPGELIFDKTMPYVKEYYHLSSIKHPKLINDFSEWIKDNPIKIQQIKTKWNVEKNIIDNGY